MEIRQRQNAARDTFVFCPHAAKKDRASIARAQQLATSWFDQVGMLGGNFGAAKFTTLDVFLAPHKLAESAKRVLESWLNSSHVWLATSADAVAITPPS